MKNRLKWMVPTLLLGIGALTLGLQQNNIGKLKEERATLLPSAEEVARLEEANKKLPSQNLKSRAGEIAELQKSTKDLQKLRGDIVVLREQGLKADGLEKAIKNLETLVDQQKSLEKKSDKLPTYKVQELQNLGYQSAENAMQTVFWALREGNLEAIIEGSTAEKRQQIRTLGAAEYKKFLEELERNSLRSVQTIRVQSKSIEAEKAQFQVLLGEKPADISLVQKNGRWFIDQINLRESLNP